MGKLRKKAPVPGRNWVIACSILALAACSIFIYAHFRSHAGFTGKERSIAVLPFMDRSDDKGNEYFADGMTDELITQLCQIKDLKVTSHAVVLPYRGSKKNIQQIAGDLQVTAILEGEIDRSGNQLKINVRLVDPNTGKTIWTAVYDRSIKQIFSIQTELPQLIAKQLNAKLTEEEKIKIIKRSTQNLEAYDQYLKGRYFWNLRNEASLRKAIYFFNQAIELDSLFPIAYSGLADCYSALGYISCELPSTAFLKAETAAIKALQLDSTLAEPHTSLGYIKFYYYWDWAGAAQEFLKAIKLNPNYELAFDSYGYYLTAMERFPEARVALQKAVQLDPLSARISTDMGFSLYYSGNYDQAVPSLKSSLELNPKFPLAHLWLGRTYQEQKMYKEAIGQYRSTLEGIPDWPVALAATGYVYGVSGQKAEAEKILAKMKALSSTKYITPYGVALVYAGLNQRDKAFEWLEKAYAERSNWLVWLKLDPRWAPIRNDRRFRELIAKIGLSIDTPLNPKG